MERRVSPRQVAGFTLLELLIAIALGSAAIGVAALCVPELIAGWRLDSAARQLMIDLRQTRMMAIHAGTKHRLHLTTASGSYSIQRQENGAYVPTSRPARLPADVVVTGYTTAGGNVAFHPRGNATTFGSVTLSHRNGAQRCVVVDMVGRIRIL